MNGQHMRETNLRELLDPANVQGVSYGEVSKGDARFVTLMVSLLTAFLSVGVFFVF